MVCMVSSEVLVPAEGLCALSAAQLRSAYAAGEATPVAVVEALFDRIETVNPRLNALYEVDRAAAGRAAAESERRWRQGAALSPLDGVPVSVKDHLAVAGFSSPRGLKFNTRTALADDCASVRLLRRAGAILFGKSNMPELSVMPVTESSLFGPTRNPLALALSPGGSSGGAAAAVAAGLGPAALASDGGGSIRIPAAFTGLVGFKPTHGRVPYFPKPTERTVAGPIARDVMDAALMMNVIARPDGRDWTELPLDPTDYVASLRLPLAPLRIAYSLDFGYMEGVDPQIAAAVLASVERLRQLGHRVEQVDRVCGDAQRIASVQAALSLRTMLTRLSPDEVAQLPRASRAVLGYAASVTLDDHQQMQEERERLVAELHEVFERFDVLVSPTVAMAPFEVGRFFPDGDILGPACRAIGGFTRPFNLAQMPALSLPCGRFANGLPISLQLAARKYQDQRLLQLGAQLEAALAPPAH